MSAPGLLVTWSVKATDAERARARQIAASLGRPLVARGALDPAERWLVVTRAGLRLQDGGRVLRWHEGMIHALRNAGPAHPWVRLSGLTPGDAVIDCTVGLGTDARFLAEYTGAPVRGFELDPALALMTREGLAAVGADVRIAIGDATDGLREMADDSAAMVIADPMFPAGQTAPSHPMALIRALGRPGAPDASWLAQALRVAQKAVVVKDTRGGDLLERLGAPTIRGRSGRAARYGVWLG